MANNGTKVFSQEEINAAAWDEAKKMSSLVGNVSSLFSSCIRFLLKDAAAGQTELSSASKYSLGRLLTSPSFKAPVYYAAKVLKQDKLAARPFLTAPELAALFSPDELAHIVGMLYVFRRIQKLSDENEWSEISRAVHLHTEIACYIGQALPKIGVGWAILLGGSRHLAWGLMHVTNKKAFTSYRRMVKQKKMTFDVPEEMKIWGCTHMHVASLMAQGLGLGGAIPKAINTGLLAEGLPDADLPEDGYKARILWQWIEALKSTGKPPEITHKGAYYPLRPELDKLIALVDAPRKKGPTELFYARGKEDVSPEKTPQLFEGEAAKEVIDAEAAAEEQNL